MGLVGALSTATAPHFVNFWKSQVEDDHGGAIFGRGSKAVVSSCAVRQVQGQ